MNLCSSLSGRCSKGKGKAIWMWDVARETEGEEFLQGRYCFCHPTYYVYQNKLEYSANSLLVFLHCFYFVFLKRVYTMKKSTHRPPNMKEENRKDACRVCETSLNFLNIKSSLNICSSCCWRDQTGQLRNLVWFNVGFLAVCMQCLSSKNLNTFENSSNPYRSSLDPSSEGMISSYKTTQNLFPLHSPSDDYWKIDQVTQIAWCWFQLIGPSY